MTEYVVLNGEAVNFEEWKRSKEAQTEPTCDHVGCTRAPVWVLPQNYAFFCAEHAAGGYRGLEAMYSEPAVLYSLWRELKKAINP